MSTPKILLAEDDANLGFVVEDHLIQEGFDVRLVKNGTTALASFRNQSFDICIIDVMMPLLDGFSLAQKIRAEDEFIPILFLTAKSMEEDRLKGFEIGGDDYITKPFSMHELIYRVRVFLRRKVNSTIKPSTFTFGRMKLDAANLQIITQSQVIQLTHMEAQLLELLLQQKNQLVKREDILVKIWGENDYFKGRSLDVFISRLRKYLNEDPDLEIRNHHGVGFMLFDRNFSG